MDNEEGGNLIRGVCWKGREGHVREEKEGYLEGTRKERGGTTKGHVGGKEREGKI